MQTGDLICVVLAVTCALSLQACYAHRGVFVQQEDYGPRWPFTVAAVYVACPEPGTLIVHTRLASYALNTTAKAKRRWRDLSQIWRTDPNRPGEHMSVDFLIERGELLCKSSCSKTRIDGHAVRFS